MSTDAQAALGRLTQMESRYQHAAGAVAQAEQALKALEAMSEAMGPLVADYQSTWLRDRKEVAALDPQLAVLGEDTVWDLTYRQHEVMTRLLRLCAGYFAAPDQD